MEIQNMLNRYRMMAVSIVTLSATAYVCPSYAIWYPCPAPSAVVAGNYAPFTVCKGNISNAQQLVIAYSNTTNPEATTFWGVCRYDNLNTGAEVYLKVIVNGIQDVLPAKWLGGPNFVCGSEASRYKAVGVGTVQFNVDVD